MQSSEGRKDTEDGQWAPSSIRAPLVMGSQGSLVAAESWAAARHLNNTCSTLVRLLQGNLLPLLQPCLKEVEK